MWLLDRLPLSNEVAAWCKTRNEDCSVADWQFTTQNARIKLKKLYPTIKNKDLINETL
jgi:hypothetical protein